MNILLLGNGFDLYHKLPTRYDNFLHTVDFLINNYTPEMTTVADVFGNEKLQEKNKFIAECYANHREVYEHISLDEEKILEIVSLAKDNIWFSYLLKSFNADIGWIDLEREISFVLKAFKEFFSSPSTRFILDKKMPTIGYRYVIIQFDFFLSSLERHGNYNAPTHKVNPEYTIAVPVNSQNILINEEKIISELSKKLDNIAKALRLYLQCFIESTLYGIKEKSLDKCSAIAYIDKAITFNYTSSYEIFYLHDSIYHLHGNVNKKIILGINPDESDKLETIDTSFVKFKKYFQRTQYNTDWDYINWINELHKPNEHMSLLVMGHSLDVTDKDIIVELFRKMDEITILYHNEEAMATYISNLIRMFGKEEFDDLRKRRKLTFLSQNTGFSDFIKKREQSSMEKIIKSFL
ncbi:MAG: hypothetical protein IJX98_00860 [Clostridia bacterium]|nr:hypothetical protein [Clostridia bacterium]